MAGMIYHMNSSYSISFTNCTNQVVHNHTEDYYNSSACGFTYESSTYFSLSNCTSNFTINDDVSGYTVGYAVGRYLNGSCDDSGLTSNWTNGWC